MAKLIIPIQSEDQLGHIYKAEDQLVKAGVTFDVGKDIKDDKEGLHPTNRVWELDWSLKGATVKEDK